MDIWGKLIMMGFLVLFVASTVAASWKAFIDPGQPNFVRGVLCAIVAVVSYAGLVLGKLIWDF